MRAVSQKAIWIPQNYSACSETSNTDPIFHLMRDLKSVITVYINKHNINVPTKFKKCMYIYVVVQFYPGFKFYLPLF